METTAKLRIDGVETVLTYDCYSGARGYQYLTPGNRASHAFPWPPDRMLLGGSFRMNGHLYEAP